MLKTSRFRNSGYGRKHAMNKTFESKYGIFIKYIWSSFQEMRNNAYFDF